MTIVIDIKPEVQAELSRQAAGHGVDIVAYAASLLEEAAHVPTESKKLNQNQLDSSHTRFLRSRRKPSLARACTGTTIDAEWQRLPARQQYLVKHQQA